MIAALLSVGWVQAAVGFAACGALILFLINRLAAAKRELKEYRSEKATRKRMDEVGRMSDADAADEWLRKRGGDL